MGGLVENKKMFVDSSRVTFHQWNMLFKMWFSIKLTLYKY